jgi:hypothetical protein
MKEEEQNEGNEKGEEELLIVHIGGGGRANTASKLVSNANLMFSSSSACELINRK